MACLNTPATDGDRSELRHRYLRRNQCCTCLNQAILGPSGNEAGYCSSVQRLAWDRSKRDSASVLQGPHKELERANRLTRRLHIRHPEYNHATSAALKNAIDFLYHEWNNKAAGFVGYGGANGVQAVENLRLVLGEIKIADLRAQAALSMWANFENFTTSKPHEQHDKAVHLMAAR